MLLAPPEVIFDNFTVQLQSYDVKIYSFFVIIFEQKIGIKDPGRVVSMLVRNVGDEMCWWQLGITINCLKVINYGPQKLFLVILCDFRSFGTNLGQNEWQKIEKINFIKKYFWPLGGTRLQFWWSEVLS